MPTQTEFEMAAYIFDEAATLLTDLIMSTDPGMAGDVVFGGSLGRQIPDRMAHVMQVASACIADALETAARCRHRAGIIADYELRLEQYEAGWRTYERARNDWQVRYSAWTADTTGTVPDPGPEPEPPRTPDPLEYSWADVPRPAYLQPPPQPQPQPTLNGHVPV